MTISSALANLVGRGKLAKQTSTNVLLILVISSELALSRKLIFGSAIVRITELVLGVNLKLKNASLTETLARTAQLVLTSQAITRSFASARLVSQALDAKQKSHSAIPTLALNSAPVKKSTTATNATAKSATPVKDVTSKLTNATAILAIKCTAFALTSLTVMYVFVISVILATPAMLKLISAPLHLVTEANALKGSITTLDLVVFATTVLSAPGVKSTLTNAGRTLADKVAFASMV